MNDSFGPCPPLMPCPLGCCDRHKKTGCWFADALAKCICCPGGCKMQSQRYQDFTGAVQPHKDLSTTSLKPHSYQKV